MLLKTSLSFVLLAFLIKVIAIFYTNFDLFGDEAQYWVWSQTIDFGYYSKPPMLAWTIALFTFFFGDSFEALKLISLITYIFTSFVIFLLSYEIYPQKKIAVITAISFYLMPAVSFSSFLLSTDVVLIFFWSLSLLFLVKLRKNPNIFNFILLGFFLGSAFLAKYAAVYFLLSLILLCFFDKKLKKILLHNYLFLFVFIFTFILLLLPNIIWNINNGWITFYHTSENAALNRSNFNVTQGAEFLLSQVFMISPLAFLFLLFSYKKIQINFETKFLLIFSMPVFFIVLAESILVRANANWAAVGLVSFSILLFNHCYNISKKILLINNVCNLLFCCTFFFLIATTSPLPIFNRISGISDFYNELNNKHLFNKNFIVVEDRLLLSNLSYLFRNSSIKILSPLSPNQKIKSHFHLSQPLKKTFDKDFILLGHPNRINYINKNYKIKMINKQKKAFKKIPIEIYEVNF